MRPAGSAVSGPQPASVDAWESRSTSWRSATATSRCVRSRSRSTPGEVVGFLGPDGAGKSTTLRLLLGLERADAGTARIDGLPYSQLRRPLLVCGWLIDSTWIYPRQSARHYLRWVAASNGLAVQRVDDALDRVGLTTVSRRQVAGLSMGMRQRLGLAAALLGDPAYLVFDEPLNGLDPEGIVWMRQLIRRLADEGRGVLL